jgi:hypothetical protein
MSIVEFTPNPKSLKLARQLLAEASKNEPEITKNIEEIAAVLQAEIVGLENRFKSEISLARKLSENLKPRGITIEQKALQINDVLRYTIVFSVEDYQNGYLAALSALDKKGYEIQKIWNAWNNEGKPTDTGYRGINVTIISFQNQQFELQFHTAESFRVKTKTHGLYAERRSPNTTRARKSEILRIMKNLVAEIERPKGI